jgi:hypothetical protein
MLLLRLLLGDGTINVHVRAQMQAVFISFFSKTVTLHLNFLQYWQVVESEWVACIYFSIDRLISILAKTNLEVFTPLQRTSVLFVELDLLSRRQPLDHTKVEI